MKRETPSDHEIAGLIAPAFECLPEPDSRRLAAIEQRLLEQARLPRRTRFAWWWLAGALVAGAASALWWAVDYDSDRGKEAPSAVVPPPVRQPADPSGQKAEPSTPAGPSAPKQGPVIYQRER